MCRFVSDPGELMMRTRIFNALLWTLKRYFTAEWEATLKERVLELASDVSVQLTQQYLDREGFAHCELCAQRFGLVRVNGKYRCIRHSATAAA
jgi:hypothetical protein